MSKIKREAPTTTHQEAQIRQKKIRKTYTECDFELDTKFTITIEKNVAYVENDEISTQITANEFKIYKTGVSKRDDAIPYIKAEMSFTLPAKIVVRARFNPYIVYVNDIGTRVCGKCVFNLDENSKFIRICHPKLAKSDYINCPKKEEESEEEEHIKEEKHIKEEEQSDETDGDY